MTPRTKAGRLLLDRIMPPVVTFTDGRISVVDAARLDAREELAEMIRQVEGEARRRRVFARYSLEGCEMVTNHEGQWVHVEEIGIKTWVLDPTEPPLLP